MAEGTVGSSEDRFHSAPSDPSALTIDALRREVAHLSDRIDLKIEGVEKALSEQIAGVVRAYDTRLGAIDRATDKFEASLTRVPTDVDRQVAQVFALVSEQFRKIETRLDGMAEMKAEQFAHIQKQFEERDLRMQQQASASQAAVAAALQAAKEAVAEQAQSAATATQKAEATQVKAIEQQAALIRQVTDANQAQIADIKDRITRMEGRLLGQEGQKQEHSSSSSFIVTLVSLGLALLMALLAASAFIRPAR
jgi:chromosome segregation ATPase